MKILKVIHGYPPLYNAGSEVYSQMICQGLAKNHEVHVFTREENLFEPEFSVSKRIDSSGDSNVQLYSINLTSERYRYRYRHQECDEVFGNLFDKIQPDVVHIGHLNHLSTSIIFEIYERKIPIIYTLHDYWLMCPRGQFIQRNGESPNDLWPVCSGQTNNKCAKHCYIGATSGSDSSYKMELDYWENWISERMKHIQDVTSLVDHFIAPSLYLYNRFVQEFNIPQERISYIDYGFDLQRFSSQRQRVQNELFTFGYIGTHIPAKGVQDLIRAFGLISDECQLRIWGRSTQNTDNLKTIVKALPENKQEKILWCGEYCNQNILKDVFNHVDCIVVPSIWVENSPLVIHEALQSRIPIITADVGGMAEYIHHEINGLLFKHRDISSLSKQLERCIHDRDLLSSISSRGYLKSSTGNIIGIDEHLQEIENLYHQAISRRSVKHEARTVANYF